jgi:ABC-type glycerol-3-phosphate transport system substrate-binding protein
MKLSARQTLTGTAAVLLLTAAAACSSSGSSPSPSGSAGSSFGVNATGTVQFWARTVSKTLAQKLVSEFNATHKNLQVKLTLTSINDDVTSPTKLESRGPRVNP